MTEKDYIHLLKIVLTDYNKIGLTEYQPLYKTANQTFKKKNSFIA